MMKGALQKMFTPRWETTFVAGALLFSLAGCGALAVTTPPAPHGTGSTAITTPYPTIQNATPIYQAPLTSQTAGWANDPACTFGPNGLSVQPQQGQAYICLAPVAALADFSVTVTTTQANGATNHGYGIAFRHNDPKSYDFFGIDSQGRFVVTIVISDRSTTIIPFTANAAIKRGNMTSNTLTVIMRGATATFLVNNVAVGQATLSDFASGTIGLRGINDGAVRFCDLIIGGV